MAQARGPSRPPRGSAPRDAVIGQRYVVRALLGRGGMGSVYQVTDTARSCEVALKLLHFAGRPQAPRDGARREQRLALFQREYHTLAELAHPRIIEVYDYGFEQSVPYYTMELLSGRDISSLMPAPWPSVCAMMRHIASALTLLHSRRLLHRDVSPSNVHRQPDGSCKLIDFGAMGAMGKQGEIVGTPPFMAPELLRHEPLDARADLYSLGALAYYLLTGRTPHPARSLAELRNYVTARPTPPSAHVRDLPSRLDALLMQLLNPEPAARPETTVEVLDRLSAIDGIEQGAPRRSMPITVSRPGLVGRLAELAEVRSSVSQATRGEGASLLVTGLAGSGRSRFLDACVLEGRLAGARVLRAAADIAPSAPYGVFATLLHQLHATLGAAEREELALPEDVARALSSRGSDASPAESSDWAGVLVQLLGYLTRVAARRCLMIAIDDFERIDDPSAHLLATLAEQAERQSLIVIATAELEALATASEPVRALRGRARQLALEPLALSDTQKLLASVFGDVPNLAPLAARIHGLSGGSPRPAMELAQHLVDSGVIRFQQGGYLLPDVIASRDLPSTLGEALRDRIRRLPPAAQKLAATLAIAGGETLSPEESFAISALSADEGATALNELAEAAIVELRAQRVRLLQPAVAEALREALSAQERQALHARIAAELVCDPARAVQAADHYFDAELASKAIDVLLSVTSNSYAGRNWYAGYSSLVERGLRACARFDRPKRDAFALQNALVQQAMSYNEPFDRAQVLAFTGELSRMCGLSDWAELSDELPAEARIAEALRRAKQRYDDTPERERALEPLPALRILVGFVSKAAGFASTTMDLELLHALPTLAPFAALSPGIALAERIVVCLRALRAGHVEYYLEHIGAACAELADAQAMGLPESEARAFDVNLRYGLGLIEAILGRPAAFVHADEIASSPNHRINAWRVRQMAHLYSADADAADACRHEVEALQIQDCSRQYLEGSRLDVEATAYGETDDLLGLRRVLPALEEMAHTHAGWRPKLWLTRADLERVLGRSQEALTHYEAVLAQVAEAAHPLWAMAAAGQLRMLVELGRAEEARELGQRYLSSARAAGWEMSLHVIELALADAEAALGCFDAARAHVERRLATTLALGVRGLNLGMTYEAGARHALLARDREAFKRYYEASAQLLRHGRSPAIAARLDRLLDQARGASLVPGKAAPEQGELTSADVIAQLSACAPAARAAKALDLMIIATGATSGHLYRLRAGRLVHAAACSPVPPPAHLEEFLARYLESVDALNDQTVDSACPTSLSGPDWVIEPVLLAASRDAERAIVGVVALCFSAGRRWPSPKVIEAIAAQLDATESETQP